MKKIIFFAVLAVAFAGLGMQAGLVHAQTSDTASLQQQLDVAKATLVNMEMNAGMVPQGDDQLSAGTAAAPSASVTPSAPATGLSASQISYFDGVLTQMAGMLSQLNTAIAANPNMSQTQISAIASTLGTMKVTVSAIATQIAEGGQGAPIAAASPSSHAATPATGNGAASGQTAQANPATSTAPATAATSTNTAPAATAQASSFWSFTKSNWPVLVIIVLVIAILAILFWPDKEAKAPTKSSGPASPSKPIITSAQNGSGNGTTAPKTPQGPPMDQIKKTA